MPERGLDQELAGEPTFQQEKTSYSDKISSELANHADSESVDLAFRLLSENLPEVFWLTDCDQSRLIYVNKAYEEIWGASRESLYAHPHSFLDFIHPDDLSMVLKKVEDQRLGRATDVEYRVLRKDGSIRWVWDRGFPIFNTAGELFRICGSALDITKRKQAEEMVKERETIFESFMKYTPTIAFMKDEQLRYVYCNHHLERHYDLQPGELTGKTAHYLFPLEIASELEASDRFVLETGQSGEFLYSIVAPKGQALTQLVYKFPIAIALGKRLIGAVVVDMTERERMLKELRSAKLEYRTIFDTVPASIIYKDGKNNILRANASAAASLGLTINQMEGRSVFDLFPETAGKAYQDDLEVMSSGTPKLGIIQSITQKSGQKRWIKTDKIPYRDENGEIIGVIAISADITESKKLSEQRDDLMSAVAHDLRVPVAGSLRALEVVLNGALGTLNQKQENFFRIMLNSHERLLELINNLVDVYRNEIGGPPMMTKFNLAQLIRTCVDELCVGHQQVKVKYVLPRSISFEGNESGIRRLILNLVGNALKFTPEGGAIEVGLERRARDKACFWVRNSGSVISADDQKRLFERFWQGQAGKKFVAGTGLGLYICHQVVEAHKGKISCMSRPKKGTTFTVLLPVRQDRTD